MSYQNHYKLILEELNQSLSGVDEETVNQLTALICQSEQVFVVGVGRVLMMLQAFTKRLNHLGIQANYVGAVDEPAITDKDVLIVGSGSGESIIPLNIARKAKELGAVVVHIGVNTDSSMTAYEDLFVRIPCSTKLARTDEVKSRQIMSSLFEQSLLLLGDAVALMIAEKNNISDMHLLWKKHANLE